MMKKLTIALLLTCSAFSLYAMPVDKDVAILKETSRAFSSVAKKAVPAVVYIESEVPAKAACAESSIDTLREDFFRRFFGAPSPEARTQKRKPEQVRGSGFIVSKDGYILTNNHVVEDATKIMVTLSGGKKVEAKIIGTDPKSDLAVIRIEGNDFAALTLGDSDALEVGEWVIAVGNPFGLDASVTVGVVSAKGRNQLHLTDFEDFIQTDAAINPGNSGGPLLDVDGTVIGINTAIVSGSGGYMGIGFAVPSNMAKNIMRQLIETGGVTRGYLGVTMQPLDEDLASAFGLKNSQGALAAEVVKGSPSDLAGLKQGDVIVAYNGTPVDNIGALRNAVSLLSPGTKLKLTVSREGKEVSLDVTVGAYPKELQSQVSNISSKLGFDVEAITAELSSKYSLSPDDKGVLVRKVVPGSLAQLAGIAPGALIIAVDRKPIAGVADFETAIKEAASKRVLLLVKQGVVVRFVVLQLE